MLVYFDKKYTEGILKNMKKESEILIKKLEKSGFTDKEALVYVTLLELGGAFPSRVAEYSGLKRPTVYNVLTTLSVRGIINEIEKKNKLFYQIDKPEKIIRYAESRVNRSNDDLDAIKKIVPEIEGMFNIFVNQPKVTYYTGIDGLLSMYDDEVSIKKPYEMLVISNVDEFVSNLPKKYLSDFIKKKAEIGITTRLLLPNTKNDKNYSENYYGSVPEKFRPKCKYVDQNKFPLVGEIIIYGDSKVSILNFSKNQMIGVTINDKSIYNMMRTIFELSWNSSLVE